LRAPRRRRPLLRRLGQAPADIDVTAVAARVRYVGSPEHKDFPSFAGQPRPRADASLCDQRLRQEEIDAWLRLAIERGAFSEYWEDGFPRYLWYKDGDTVYEGRLINRDSGEYKGWPLERSEWPAWINTLYE
jgi:hypothetical protein